MTTEIIFVSGDKIVDPDLKVLLDPCMVAMNDQQIEATLNIIRYIASGYVEGEEDFPFFKVQATILFRVDRATNTSLYGQMIKLIEEKSNAESQDLPLAG